MSGKGIRIYSNEFRESTIKLVLDSKESIAENARRLGIKVDTLYNWISKHSKKTDQENSTMDNDKNLQEEVRRLKRELARVTEERDILKKATAYFAKETR